MFPSMHPQSATYTNTLADYTSAELIIPQLRSRSPAAVVGELCALLQREQRLGDALSFYNSVISHEYLAGTVTSPGWALPHARVPGLPGLSFALGRAPTPLGWFDHAGDRIRLVFLIAVPENESGTYLALLSSLAKLSENKVMVEKLYGARDAIEVFDLLRQVRLHHAPCAAPSPV
jgi:mannitol/fructose-specific phosphotransferase system IIA component (Ntr-type)